MYLHYLIKSKHLIIFTILVIIFTIMVYNPVKLFFYPDSEDVAYVLDNYSPIIVDSKISLEKNAEYELYLIYKVYEGEGASDIFLIGVDKNSNRRQIIYEDYVFKKKQIVDFRDDDNLNISFEPEEKFSKVSIVKNKLINTSKEVFISKISRLKNINDNFITI